MLGSASLISPVCVSAEDIHRKILAKGECKQAASLKPKTLDHNFTLFPESVVTTLNAAFKAPIIPTLTQTSCLCEPSSF